MDFDPSRQLGMLTISILRMYSNAKTLIIDWFRTRQSKMGKTGTTLKHYRRRHDIQKERDAATWALVMGARTRHRAWSLSPPAVARTASGGLGRRQKYSEIRVSVNDANHDHVRSGAEVLFGYHVQTSGTMSIRVAEARGHGPRRLIRSFAIYDLPRNAEFS